MPNIKSAKKRVEVIAKKTEQNKIIRSEVKTEIKKVLNLIKEEKIAEATTALSTAFSVIDSACSKNIIHANKAANLKAKLSKKLDVAKKQAPVAEEKVEEVKAEVVVEATEEVKEEKKPAAKKTTTKKTTTKKAEEKAE